MDEFRPNHEDEDHGYPFKPFWDKLEPKQRALFVTAIVFCFIAAVTTLISYTPSVAQTARGVKLTKVEALRAEIAEWAKKYKLHVTIITDCRLASADRGRLGKSHKDHCIVSTNPIERPWVVVCETVGTDRVCYRGY